MSAHEEKKKKPHKSIRKKCKDAEFQRICELPEKDRLAEYVETAEAGWDRGWEILHDPEDWRHDKGTDLHTGTVHSKHYHGEGRCFKLQGYVDCTPQRLFEHLVVDVELAAEWNPTIIESKVLLSIKDNIDIHYTLTRELGGGIIAKRDYVNLRHWKTKDGTTLSGGIHTSHPDKPPTKKVVRGENRPGGWVFSPVENDPSKCLFGWLVNTDFGGWLPQWTIDQALAGELMKFLENIRKYVALKAA